MSIVNFYSYREKIELQPLHYSMIFLIRTAKDILATLAAHYADAGTLDRVKINEIEDGSGKITFVPEEDGIVVAQYHSGQMSMDRIDFSSFKKAPTAEVKAKKKDTNDSELFTQNSLFGTKEYSAVYDIRKLNDVIPLADERMEEFVDKALNQIAEAFNQYVMTKELVIKDVKMEDKSVGTKWFHINTEIRRLEIKKNEKVVTVKQIYSHHCHCQHVNTDAEQQTNIDFPMLVDLLLKPNPKQTIRVPRNWQYYKKLTTTEELPLLTPAEQKRNPLPDNWSGVTYD